MLLQATQEMLMATKKMLCFGSSLAAHWVKDPALSLQRLRLRLWHGLNPCPWKFHMLQACPKKKKKREREAAMFEPPGRCQGAKRNIEGEGVPALGDTGVRGVTSLPTGLQSRKQVQRS